MSPPVSISPSSIRLKDDLMVVGAVIFGLSALLAGCGETDPSSVGDDSEAVVGTSTPLSENADSRGPVDDEIATRILAQVAADLG